MAGNAWILSACAVLAMCQGVSQAQSPEARDAWLMKNYRFTGPPAPGSIAPVDPVLSELRQIQDTLMSILRKADFSRNYEAALYTAQEAAANAQLIGSITERLQAAAAAQTGANQPNVNVPVYSIAFKDHTTDSAIAYWTDGLMLHYVTPHGAHVQVRLDLVDRDLSIRLNRARNLQFDLPE
jgi:hypothetical protein